MIRFVLKAFAEVVSVTTVVYIVFQTDRVILNLEDNIRRQ